MFKHGCGGWFGAAAALAVAGVTTLIVATGVVYWLDAKQSSGRADANGFVTLHASTFRNLVDESDEIAMVFAGGTQAIVADNLWQNRQLFLIDLEAGTSRTVEVPNAGNLSLKRLYYAGDAVVAEFTTSVEKGDTFPFLIDRTGKLKPLIYKEYISVLTTEAPIANSDDLEPLLRAGKLDNLTHVQQEICKRDGDGVYRATQLGRVAQFFNDQYFVVSNISAMRERLMQNAVTSIVDSCTRRDGAAPDGFALKIERTDASSSAADSAALRRIRSATISQGGQTVKAISFDLSNDFYFYAVPIGQRLYFIGNHVKYLDLAAPMAK